MILDFTYCRACADLSKHMHNALFVLPNACQSLWRLAVGRNALDEHAIDKGHFCMQSNNIDSANPC